MAAYAPPVNALSAESLRELEKASWDEPAAAQQWVAIYRRLLDVLDAVPRKSGPGLDRAVEYRRRCQARLDQWQERARSLAGLQLVDRTLRCGANEVRLTPRERELIAAFLRQPGVCLSARALIQEAWDGWLSEEQLRTYIVRLRRKLIQIESRALIAAVRGRGYELTLNGLGEAGEPAA